MDEIRALYEDGDLPGSEGKAVPYLFIVLTGLTLLYRGRRREGRRSRQASPKKGGRRFWEGFSLSLAGKYGLARTGKVIAGGYGASRVKEGAELFAGLYEVHRFHLKRALQQTLGNDAVAARIQEVDRERAKEVMKLRGCLMDNYYGLRDYRLELNGQGLRGLGL